MASFYGHRLHDAVVGDFAWVHGRTVQTKLIEITAATKTSVTLSDGSKWSRSGDRWGHGKDRWSDIWANTVTDIDAARARLAEIEAEAAERRKRAAFRRWVNDNEATLTIAQIDAAMAAIAVLKPKGDAGQ